MTQYMTHFDGLMNDAIARDVADGMTEAEATEKHMTKLAANYPNMFAAYSEWLASK